MWIFPKIADFDIFDRFLAKNPPELSGDTVSTEHQIHGKGVIFDQDSLHLSSIKFLHLSNNWTPLVEKILSAGFLDSFMRLFIGTFYVFFF